MSRSLTSFHESDGPGSFIRWLTLGLARTLTRAVSNVSSAQAVARLSAENFAQADVIRRQAEALAHYKKIIDRSSSQAKIGVWECNLADQSLTWTTGTYDLFELPRDTPVTREQIMALYDADSCRQMEALRAKAIAERGQFTLDARITTATGKARWMRLTATVECENGVPIRIFGLKQDVTEEKALLERLRVLAERDPLTGLANRGLVQTRLGAPPDKDADRVGALLLLDLDGFKQINDTFGHAAGDECLRQVAVRLQRVFDAGDLVARMGGDEFAIVVKAGTDREHLAEQVHRILVEIRDPIGWATHKLHVGASIGIAFADPHSVCEASQLIIDADMALYAAKADGRNTSRIFNEDRVAERRRDDRPGRDDGRSSRPAPSRD